MRDASNQSSNHNSKKHKKSNSPFFSFNHDPVQTQKEATVFQPKLHIGKAGDKYEKEADAVADRVMSGASLQNRPLASTITPLMQKQSIPEEEENLQTQSIEEQEVTLQPQSEEEEEAIQTKSKSGGAIAPKSITSQLRSSKGGGYKLAKSTNQYMSKAFGTDFSHVRIHTGSLATEMNQKIKARAFTHGKDIYFNKGEYDPQSGAGKRLLAHELTHTIQQTNANRYLQRQSPDRCPKSSCHVHEEHYRRERDRFRDFRRTKRAL